MPTYLKKPRPAAESDAANAKVQETVATIIADIRHRGDLAVRELSERFDGWSPSDFRLSQREIDSIVASVPQETIEDIRFAQAQIRNFAEQQRATLKDIEVETVPGVGYFALVAGPCMITFATLLTSWPVTKRRMGGYGSVASPGAMRPRSVRWLTKAMRRTV